MFRVIFLFAVYLSHVRTSSVYKSETYGTEWVVFSDSKGKPHYVNLTIPIKQRIRHLSEQNLIAEPSYWLYTRKTIKRPEAVFPSVRNSTSYIQSAPLIVITHGWTGHRDVDSTQFVKNAILKTDITKNKNVVIMDWSSMENDDYVYSAYSTLRVAEKLKNFVKRFSKLYKVPASKIHLIGHSLGAHVVGLAGAKLKEDSFLVSRVTGLDPARPFFELPEIFPGISNNSGAFVDIIHTSSGILGVCKPVGHADFFPGGGRCQPALCPSSILGACEHRSSYVYFVKSFQKKLRARRCHDYLSYSKGLCDGNEVQYMGYPCRPTARGSYFLDITSLTMPAKLG